VATTTQQLESQAEKSATAALSFIPVVGPALAGIAAVVEGIFASSHAAAVQKEAAVLNQATPNFVNTASNVMKLAGEGALTPSEALTALQQAETAYYSAVSSIIKKSSTCKPPNYGADDHSGKDCTVFEPSTWKDCDTGSSCNASCAIGCGMVEPTVTALTTIIKAGKGSFTIPASPSNGAINTTPAVSITYLAPNVLTTIESVIEGKVQIGTAISSLAATGKGKLELALAAGGIVLIFAAIASTKT
jgi:hypothetical protein